jgi:hypothetical protein
MRFACAFAFVFFAVERLSAGGTNFVVALSGDAPFKSVQTAINLAPSGGEATFFL